MEASPHDPREAIIRLLGRQSRENLVRADGFIPRPRPIVGAKPLQCCCVDTRRAIPLLRLSKDGSKSEMRLGEIRLAPDDFFEGGDGLVQLPLVAQGEAKIAVSAGVFRVELDGLAVAGDGLVRLLLGGQGVAEVVVGASRTSVGWLRPR